MTCCVIDKNLSKAVFLSFALYQRSPEEVHRREIRAQNIAAGNV